MKIGSFNTDQRVFVIAEIGNNHEGKYELAEKLIHLAKEAGADAVKFQTIVPEKFVRPQDEKRFAHMKRFQLSYEEFEKLKRVADMEGILFLSTPFDLESASFLNLFVPAFKIASGDNNFYPLLEAVARIGKPILLSTGFADLPQIQGGISVIEEVWKECGCNSDLALLHCVSSYPVKPEEANIAAIKTLCATFPQYTIGYSDHTIGYMASISAVAAGARIVEKHFTIDKKYSDFRDHLLSADPEEMKEMIERVREVEILLGNGDKILQEGECAILQSCRRSIVATRDLPKDVVITKGDLTWMRPQGGLAPGQEHLIVGKILIKPVKMGEWIVPDFVV